MIFKSQTTKQAGFTLIEMILVLAITAFLLGFIAINLTTSQRKASLSTTVTTFITDLHQQQMKAMTGDTEGRASADSYGVHLDTNKYVLFYGTSYNALDTSNSPITLENGLQFGTSGVDVIFSQLNGEISNPLSVILQDTTNGTQKTIDLNKYGIVIAVD